MEALKEEEEPAEEQSPERRSVETLLELSEEVKEEVMEYRCSFGWDEAVHGWSRAAPLSCIFITRKPKRPDTSSPSSPNDPEGPSSELRGEAHVSSKKPTTSNDPERTVFQKITTTTTTKPSNLHHAAVKQCEKVPKKSPRPDSIAVPIRNFTFLPPIVSSRRVSGRFYSSITVPHGEPQDQNVFVFGKKIRTRGTRSEPISEPPVSPETFWTCQHHPGLFSAVTVPHPNRYLEPSRTDTHRYSLDRRLTPAGGPGPTFTNNTVCTS